MQNKNDQQMKEFVVSLLQTKIPPAYYYHNYHHTLYVMDKAIEIGGKENRTQEELRLLTAGALWHDTGFINTYADHEKESCRLAAEYLPEYGYTDDEIKLVQGMIMATQLPQMPQNKLEEIIADADLEYLGTSLAWEQADDLYKEFKSIRPNLSESEWNQIQIGFLQNHHYFTNFCKENREPKKLLYLKGLLDSVV